MIAARLHGPRDLRIEEIASPGEPGPGEALLDVRLTTICGSDLHTYVDGRIGTTAVEKPLVLGHEFSAVVRAVGPGARDGRDRPLEPGALVAVDPAMPCGRCDYCVRGYPNLCLRLGFCGLFPENGSLRESMRMPGRCCFPVPPEIDDVDAALLEPLGIALHAVDLARVRVAEPVAVLGGGPIGLLTAALASLAGAHPVVLTEPLPWRRALASHYGVTRAIDATRDPTAAVVEAAGGGGPLSVVECAWGEDTAAQAAEMARPGGRVVLVGISGRDALELRGSTVRRKGLEILACRRMRHAYPRCIELARRRAIDLAGLVSHTAPLADAARIFDLNADYRDGVVKAAIRVTGPADEPGVAGLR